MDFQFLFIYFILIISCMCHNPSSKQLALFLPVSQKVWHKDVTFAVMSLTSWTRGRKWRELQKLGGDLEGDIKSENGTLIASLIVERKELENDSKTLIEVSKSEGFRIHSLDSLGPSQSGAKPD